MSSKGSRRGHVTYFWNFGTPSISRERFELETSNLACKLTIGGTNDNNEKLGQRGSGRGHVTYFWNFGTASISRERFELETSNLARRLTIGGTNDNNEKIRSNGVEKGSSDLLLEFWDPLHISGTVRARNFKFGRQIDHRGH